MNHTDISLGKTWLLSAGLLAILIACPIVIGFTVAAFWRWWVLDQTHNNSKMILHELHNYHDRHGHFPPIVSRGGDGRALHSWRTSLHSNLSAAMDHMRLTGIDFSKPWDDPANLEIETRYPLTRYPYQFLAIVGPGAAWDEAGVRSLSDFKDGSSQTVLAIALRNTEIPWYQPGDARFDGKTLWLGDPADNRKLPISHDLFLLMADGQVHYCGHGLSEETLRALITIDAGDGPGINWYSN